MLYEKRTVVTQIVKKTQCILCGFCRITKCLDHIKIWKLFLAIQKYLDRENVCTIWSSYRSLNTYDSDYRRTRIGCLGAGRFSRITDTQTDRRQARQCVCIYRIDVWNSVDRPDIPHTFLWNSDTVDSHCEDKVCNPCHTGVVRPFEMLRYQQICIFFWNLRRKHYPWCNTGVLVQRTLCNSCKYNARICGPRVSSKLDPMFSYRSDTCTWARIILSFALIWQFNSL